MFLTQSLFFFFLMVIFTTLFQRGSMWCKSTLKMTFCFDVVQVNVEINNADSTLFNIVNSNVDVHVVSTLTWRCPMSQRQINLRTTLKQRWNVCWDLRTALFYSATSPTSYRRLIDVERTSCVYWVGPISVRFTENLTKIIIEIKSINMAQSKTETC